jgi:hypothetical protein
VKGRVLVLAIALVCGAAMGARAQAPIDSSLSAFIARIRAVDNHTHANTVVPADSDYDALPLDGLPPFPVPERLRPDSPPWIAAYRALYGYKYADLTDAHMAELRATMVLRGNASRLYGLRLN